MESLIDACVNYVMKTDVLWAEIMIVYVETCVLGHVNYEIMNWCIWTILIEVY